MSVGDKVFTVDVFHDKDGPLVLVYERTVSAVIDDGVVCRLGDNCSVFQRDRLFADREAANARAVELIRSGLSTIVRRYGEAIEKLLTPAAAAV